MSDEKWTPGPWFVDSSMEVGPVSRNDDQTYGMILPVADVYGEPMEANAKLIAAAPELYEALFSAMKFIESHVADPDMTEEMCKSWNDLQKATPYAALTKARGDKQ